MADTHYLALTVSGDDRPGLVAELADIISAHEGSWLESSMSHLADMCVGIVKVAVASDRAAAFKDALAGMDGLTVKSVPLAADLPAKGRRLKLTLVGHDRIGIVREVSQVLARHAVNIEDLATRTSSAPMSAEILFHAEATLLAAAELDVRALTDELERISNDLMVDIALDEA